MIKEASKMMDQISKWMSDNPTAATSLLTGGVGALGGLLLTSSNPDESTADSLKRRLKNALVLGGLGAGVGALGSTALKQFGTAMPAPPPVIPDTPLVDNSKKYGSIIGAGLAGGAGATYAAKKIFDKFQGSQIRNIAKYLNKGTEIKDLAQAKDFIETTISNSKNLSRIAGAFRNVGGTTAENIATGLRKLNLVPKHLASADLKTALTNIPWWKLKGRTAGIGAAAALGTILAGGGGYYAYDKFFKKK